MGKRLDIVYTEHGSTKFDRSQVLIRAYSNQSANAPEEEQCAGDVVISESVKGTNRYEWAVDARWTAWLPRGLASATFKYLKENRKKLLGKKIIISNEVPTCIGVLTSCNSNFKGALQNELSESKFKVKNL